MINRKYLADFIPDPAILLRLPTEQVAKQLLKVCASARQNGKFSPSSAFSEDGLFGDRVFGGTAYPRSNAEQLELAAAEAFEWLKIHGLVMPAPSPNQTYYRLTRKGEALLSNEAEFLEFAALESFPQFLIHPAIREKVWLQASLGEWPVAVFIAFRAVEEAVRKAGGYALSDVGVSLMRAAFHKDHGPLRRESDPVAEQEALGALFAGAIGSYKNPHSHRTVSNLEADEAKELLILASHLLRIVDDRSS